MKIKELIETLQKCPETLKVMVDCANCGLLQVEGAESEPLPDEESFFVIDAGPVEERLEALESSIQTLSDEILSLNDKIETIRRDES